MPDERVLIAKCRWAIPTGIVSCWSLWDCVLLATSCTQVTKPQGRTLVGGLSWAYPSLLLRRSLLKLSFCAYFRLNWPHTLKVVLG
jgi:hypothetical protein